MADRDPNLDEAKRYLEEIRKIDATPNITGPEKARLAESIIDQVDKRVGEVTVAGANRSDSALGFIYQAFGST